MWRNYTDARQTEKGNVYEFDLWHGSIASSLVALQPVDSASDFWVAVSPASMLSPWI